MKNVLFSSLLLLSQTTSASDVCLLDFWNGPEGINLASAVHCSDGTTPFQASFFQIFLSGPRINEKIEKIVEDANDKMRLQDYERVEKFSSRKDRFPAHLYLKQRASDSGSKKLCLTRKQILPHPIWDDTIQSAYETDCNDGAVLQITNNDSENEYSGITDFMKARDFELIGVINRNPEKSKRSGTVQSLIFQGK